MDYFDLYRNRLLFSALLICALMLFTAIAGSQHKAVQATTDEIQKADNSRLEVIEELSESLANDLLELSVATRESDLQLTSEFLPAEIAAKPFPSRPTLIKNQFKWVSTHNWETKETSSLSLSTDAGKIINKAFLSNWSEFLSHFSEIEDARFKVKESNFE